MNLKFEFDYSARESRVFGKSCYCRWVIESINNVGSRNLERPSTNSRRGNECAQNVVQTYICILSCGYVESRSILRVQRPGVICVPCFLLIRHHTDNVLLLSVHEMACIGVAAIFKATTWRDVSRIFLWLPLQISFYERRRFIPLTSTTNLWAAGKRDACISTEKDRGTWKTWS